MVVATIGSALLIARSSLALSPLFCYVPGPYSDMSPPLLSSGIRPVGGASPASRAHMAAFDAEVRLALQACYSDDELDQIEYALAQPCAALHLRVNLLRRSRDELVADLLVHKALVGFTVTPFDGLDDVVAIHRRPSATELAPYITLDRSGVRSPQRFIERKARKLPPHEILVDRICGEAILKGADIFVKGIRSASMGLTAGSTVSVYVDLFGAQLRGSVCESLEGMRFLGVGVCLLNRNDLFNAESGLGVRMEHVVEGDLPALRGVLPDQLYVQSLPSLTVAHVLGAQPGERVIDLCAAPGSKAGHVATNFLQDAPGSLLVAVREGDE